MLTVVGTYFLLVGLHYMVNVGCSYKIWMTAKQSAEASGRMSPLTKQLNRVLALQVPTTNLSVRSTALVQEMTPFLVGVVPILTYFALMILQEERLDRLLEFLTSIAARIPVMNPVFAICFMKAYRQVLLEYIGFRKERRQYSAEFTPASDMFLECNRLLA